MLLAKVTFECVGFSEAFNPRGICISPVYPPTPTTLLPPSLTETHRARGERGPSAEWRIKASHIPPALVSPHNLGSAMSSPVTLPYINLEKRQTEEQKREMKITLYELKGELIRMVQGWKGRFWIRKCIWEQKVSLLINELGVSSFPEGGPGVGCMWRLLDIPNRLVSCVDQGVGWVRRRSRPTGAPSTEEGTAQKTAASSLPQPGPWSHAGSWKRKQKTIMEADSALYMNIYKV